MASTDLKGAFFSELVHIDHQRFFSLLVFQMNMDLQWGYLLRSKGHSSVVYMDDLYLKVDKYESCFNNVFDTMNKVL